MFTGLTKGENIVASDPFPQTIKNFEVHSEESCWYRSWW